MNLPDISYKILYVVAAVSLLKGKPNLFMFELIEKLFGPEEKEGGVIEICNIILTEM